MPVSFDCHVFQPNATGELKTKPTQNAVRRLRELGLSADFVSISCCTFSFPFVWCLTCLSALYFHCLQLIWKIERKQLIICVTVLAGGSSDLVYHCECVQIVCRSSAPLNDNVKVKISNFCHVSEQQVCVNCSVLLYSSVLLLIQGYPLVLESP